MLTLGRCSLIDIRDKLWTRSDSSVCRLLDLRGLGRVDRDVVDLTDDVRRWPDVECREFSIPSATTLTLPTTELTVSSTCVMCDISESPEKTRFCRLTSLFICSMRAAAFCRYEEAEYREAFELTVPDEEELDEGGLLVGSGAERYECRRSDAEKER